MDSVKHACAVLPNSTQQRLCSSRMLPEPLGDVIHLRRTGAHIAGAARGYGMSTPAFATAASITLPRAYLSSQDEPGVAGSVVRRNFGHRVSLLSVLRRRPQWTQVEVFQPFVRVHVRVDALKQLCRVLANALAQRLGSAWVLGEEMRHLVHLRDRTACVRSRPSSVAGASTLPCP